MTRLGDEDRLIEWLRSRLSAAGQRLVGDDGAILPAQGLWTVTVDQQIAGTHFPKDLDPVLVARRLVAVNLSDLAAIGARPAYAFLALAFPKGFDARRFFKGLLEVCGRHDLKLAGGDVARSPTLAASLTLLGHPVRGGCWLQRSAARPDDLLWIGGALGESAAGRYLVGLGARLVGRRVTLPAVFSGSARTQAAARRAVRRHLGPRPQLELSQWLTKQRRVAAIDISDGLAIDLHRLCRQSQVGALIEGQSLPTPHGFESLCQELGHNPRQLVLSGGEDYVLVFTLPPRVTPPPRFGCCVIGAIRASRQVEIRERDGVYPLAPTGWDHLAS